MLQERISPGESQDLGFFRLFGHPATMYTTTEKQDGKLHDFVLLTVSERLSCKEARQP